MRRILEFAEHYYILNGRSPSTAEIGGGIGVNIKVADTLELEVGQRGHLLNELLDIAMLEDV